MSEAKETSASAPQSKPGRRCSLSLFGTGVDSMEGLSQKRRTSVIAVSSDQAVKAAPAEEQVEVLLAAMRKENAKTLEDLEPEFCSWALSCIAELSAGNESNRNKILREGDGEGGLDLLFDYMKKFPEDWQGCDALGRLGEDICASSGKYEGKLYMEKSTDQVLGCLNETDISELGLTGTRALTNMAKASDAAKEYMNSVDAASAISALLDLFPAMNNFQYNGQQFLSLLAQSESKSESKTAGDDSKADGESKQEDAKAESK